ncbi:MAG: hypothetical protein LBI47_02775 [Puniceicoccales bacterium]|jgi:hypothetical protein|nr:hypothetical protein [Puniceicoccales bacterium]
MNDEYRINEILMVLFHPTVNRHHDFFSHYSLSPADCDHILETVGMFEMEMGYMLDGIKGHLKTNTEDVKGTKRNPQKILGRVDKLRDELEETLGWFERLTNFVDGEKKKDGYYTTVRISSYNSQVAHLMNIFYDIQTLETNTLFNL